MPEKNFKYGFEQTLKGPNFDQVVEKVTACIQPTSDWLVSVGSVAGDWQMTV